MTGGPCGGPNSRLGAAVLFVIGFISVPCALSGIVLSVKGFRTMGPDDGVFTAILVFVSGLAGIAGVMLGAIGALATYGMWASGI